MSYSHILHVLAPASPSPPHTAPCHVKITEAPTQQGSQPRCPVSTETSGTKTKTSAATRDKTAITGPLIRHQELFNGSTQKA